MSTHRYLTALGAATLAAVALVPAAATAAPSTADTTPVLVLGTADLSVGSPALSYTGRYLAYGAIRTGAGPLANQQRRLDLASGRDVLLNPAVGGGLARGRYSMPLQISGDGTRVSFTSSSAALLPGDDNNTFDAFVRDVPSRETLLASAALDGGFPNGATGSSSMSRDGRFVVFTSTATDLVADSGTKNIDVYRRDLVSGTTDLVSVRPDGKPSNGPGANSVDLSADGHLVAFTSYDSDLAAADGDDQETDLFVRNMTTGRTRWLSASFPAGANPDSVVMSPDGRWVTTRWTDGGLHLTDVRTGATETVVANGYALKGAFSSAAGRLVFVSGGQPFVRDLAAGTNSPIPTPGGTGFAGSVTISGDGRYAAYGWAPSDTSPGQIYLVRLS